MSGARLAAGSLVARLPASGHRESLEGKHCGRPLPDVARVPTPERSGARMPSDPSSMPEDPGPVQDVQVAIATELLAILRDSYGTGATAAKAYVNEDSVVVFFDDLQLQRSEEYLIGAGEGQAVT